MGVDEVADSGYDDDPDDDDHIYDEINELNDIDSKSCECLPACQSISYDAEISQTDMNVIRHYNANNLLDADDKE